MNEHPRTREIESYAAGEAAPETSRHVEQCDVCRAEVERLALERERLLARLPPVAFIAQVSLRREATLHRARRRLAWSSGVGAVAVAAVVALLLIRRDDLPARGDGVRLKGVGLEVFRRRGDRVEVLGAEDRVRAGDGLRIVVTLPEAQQRVSVFFVDAEGRVDHFPAPEPLALAAGENILPGAVVVDDPCVALRLVVRTTAGEFSRSLECE